MPLPFPIAPSQTDAKSPIDAQLMDAIREDLNYLDSQIGAGGGGGASVNTFRVNGPISQLAPLIPLGYGKRLDGAIVTNATTFSSAKLSLLKGGSSGAVEVDVLRHIPVNHPITEITAQYFAATQSIGRLGTPISTQSVSRATPVISTQQITKVKPALAIRSIMPIGNSRFLYTFTGSTLLDADYQVGDSILFSGTDDAPNNGEFTIVQTNYDGLPSVVVVNPNGQEQNTATGTATLSMYSFVYLATVSPNFAVGEEVIFTGHTFAGNNGTRTIYAVNLGANNIVVKYAGGQEQAGVAGSAACTRWVYSYAAPVDITHYIVGEKAIFASHSSAANNGSFIIRAVNDGGSNLVVTNTAGVAQAGAAGNVNTLRWLYGLPSSPLASINLGDKVKLLGHTPASNDGTFEVKQLNRFGVNNIEIYNEAGVTQLGGGGSVTTSKKIVKFDQDYSASYLAGASKVLLEGLRNTSDNVSIEFIVVEVNRGGFSNYNLVIEAENLNFQRSPAGRVATEARSIFTTRPRIEITQAGRIRNFLFSTAAVLDSEPVPSDSLLTMDILEVPLGGAENLLLSIS